VRVGSCWLAAERLKPLIVGNSRSEAAVKGDHREPRQRACPLTAARAEGIPVLPADAVAFCLGVLMRSASRRWWLDLLC
jgi:hypothetical protein